MAESHLRFPPVSSDSPMPHYYFHLREGRLHEAELGEILPDADAARAHARKAANETARKSVRRGLGRLTWLLDDAALGADFH